MDAWLKDVAAAVAQDVITQIQCDIIDRFVASQAKKKIPVGNNRISWVCKKTNPQLKGLYFSASGVILQWDRITVRNARAEVKYCLKDGGSSLPFLVEK